MLNRILNTRHWVRIVLGLFYLLVIVLLSLLPTSSFPDIPYFSGEDKWIHFCMYLGLGFMTCWRLDTGGRHAVPTYILIIGVGLWGVLMEILQRLMANGRSLEWLDMLANLGGAAAGLYIYRYLSRVNKKG